MTTPKLSYVAGTVIVLNLFDAIFTILYTRLGVATEANPLMDQVLSASPIIFMITKLMLVSLGVCLLWRFRDRRSAAAGLIVAVSAYAWLLVHHLSAAYHLAPLG
jgi:hypothetical protein